MVNPADSASGKVEDTQISSTTGDVATTAVDSSSPVESATVTPQPTAIPADATIDRGRFDTTDTEVVATPSSDYEYDASSVEEKKVGFVKGFLTLRFMESRWLRDVGLLILRLATLPLMLYGVHWLLNVSTFASVLENSVIGQVAPYLFAWLTVLAYLILPVLISLGIFTRWAGLILASVFAMVIVTVDIPNKGIIGGDYNALTFESAFLYFVLGLGAFFLGAGRLSVDNILGGIRRANR